MKTHFDIKKLVNMKTRTLIISGIFILFLVIGSSIAMAYTGFLDDNKSFDIKKNIVNHTEFSPKLEFAPENPEFVKYQRNIVSNPMNFYSLNEYRTGFIPAPVDLRHLSTHRHLLLSSSISGANTSTPTHYDLRKLNRTTYVKDQGNAGNCWAFATYASLESYLMPRENWDFSENNLKNLLSPAYLEGFDLNEGGNIFMSTAYLTRWSGPIAGNNDPYNDSSTYSPRELGLPLQKHVQNVLFLPDRHGSLDNEEIKWAVQNYGAVWTTLYYNPTSYSSTKHNYYYKGTSSPNHAVAIVGWDDSFDKNNFSQVPLGNGAFIVKNSWGPHWGDNGYFHVSYYDSSIGSSNNGVFTAENPNDYTNIYQYDPLGWTGNFGYGSQTGWCANIFTAKSNEVLEAVSFYTTDLNCNYKIYIYTNPSSTPISQDDPVLTQSGVISMSGYHTINLSSGVQLKADQKFSIILKLTNSKYNYPIAVESPISGYSSKAKANAGESFVSSDGNSWKDITTDSSYSNTNVCIKAFTYTGNISNVADFFATTNSGNIPLDIVFTDKSTGSPISWYWDFGDRTYSTIQNPKHHYSETGNYTVSLTVTNAIGNNTITKPHNITVTAVTQKTFCT